jgi:hypothetical protein
VPACSISERSNAASIYCAQSGVLRCHLCLPKLLATLILAGLIIYAADARGRSLQPPGRQGGLGAAYALNGRRLQPRRRHVRCEGLLASRILFGPGRALVRHVVMQRGHTTRYDSSSNQAARGALTPTGLRYGRQPGGNGLALVHHFFLMDAKGLQEVLLCRTETASITAQSGQRSATR